MTPVRYFTRRFELVAWWIVVGCSIQSPRKINTSSSTTSTPVQSPCPGDASANHVRPVDDLHTCKGMRDASGADRYSELACVCAPFPCPTTIAAAIDRFASPCRPQMEDFASTVHESPFVLIRRDGCGIVQISHGDGFESVSYSYDALTGVLLGVVTTTDFCVARSCTSTGGRTFEGARCAHASECRLCGAGTSFTRCNTELACGVDLTTPIDRRIFQSNTSAQ
jgi:hypothetical protein